MHVQPEISCSAGWPSLARGNDNCLPAAWRTLVLHTADAVESQKHGNVGEIWAFLLTPSGRRKLFDYSLKIGKKAEQR
jgi:hypothetical protein